MKELLKDGWKGMGYFGLGLLVVCVTLLGVSLEMTGPSAATRHKPCQCCKDAGGSCTCEGCAKECWKD